MRGDQKGSTLAELPVNVTKGFWDEHKRGTANPDAGQGFMEEDICGRLDVAPTW